MGGGARSETGRAGWGEVEGLPGSRRGRRLVRPCRETRRENAHVIGTAGPNTAVPSSTAVGRRVDSGCRCVQGRPGQSRVVGRTSIPAGRRRRRRHRHRTSRSRRSGRSDVVRSRPRARRSTRCGFPAGGAAWHGGCDRGFAAGDRPDPRHEFVRAGARERESPGSGTQRVVGRTGAVRIWSHQPRGTPPDLTTCRVVSIPSMPDMRTSVRAVSGRRSGRVNSSADVRGLATAVRPGWALAAMPKRRAAAGLGVRP